MLRGEPQFISAPTVVLFMFSVVILSSSAQTTPTGASFSGQVIVDASRPQNIFSSGEPSLFVDRQNGDLWVSAIAPTQLYRSQDGGKTFTFVPLPYGSWQQSGSDAHVITDSAGRVHALDQIGTQCLFYIRSTDGGKTFSTTTFFGNGTLYHGTSPTCTGAHTDAVDRPWLASYGNNIYIVYNNDV